MASADEQRTSRRSSEDARRAAPRRATAAIPSDREGGRERGREGERGRKREGRSVKRTVQWSNNPFDSLSSLIIKHILLILNSKRIDLALTVDIRVSLIVIVGIEGGRKGGKRCVAIERTLLSFISLSPSLP